VTDPVRRTSVFEDRVFLFLVVVVSLAFAWILRPYAGAILWGVVLAVVFARLNRRLRGPRDRRTLAALGTLALIVVLVILPLGLILVSLLQEATSIVARIQSGELDLNRYFEQITDALPAWATSLLDRYGLADLSAIQARLSGALTRIMQFLAEQALRIGQNTLDFVIKLFVMLYLLFFLLRDGDELVRRIRNAFPLSPGRQQNLARRFTIVVRATIKGNLVVALVQGALAGLIFWVLGIGAPLLLGVLTALLSLLPAVGAPVVWAPVAIYLLATGAIWRAVTLILFGALVIGLADNILRPILVGKDTKLPDYLVLISTLGGLAVFGINGFVLGPVIAALFVAVWEIFVTSRIAAAAPE
jgi:predicted PurR-regulated permease PerM